MKNTSISDDQLLDYLDGSLSQGEQQRIESILSQDFDLKKRFEELKTIQRFLKNLNAAEPSKNFTQVVMGRLDQYPVKKGFSFFNAILLLVGVLTTITIAAIMVSNGFFDGTTSLDLNAVKIPKLENQQLPSFTVDGKLMVNVIIMLNLAVAFIVLDKMILKPLFRNRIQSSH